MMAELVTFVSALETLVPQIQLEVDFKKTIKQLMEVYKKNSVYSSKLN